MDMSGTVSWVAGETTYEVEIALTRDKYTNSQGMNKYEVTVWFKDRSMGLSGRTLTRWGARSEAKRLLKMWQEEHISTSGLGSRLAGSGLEYPYN